MRFFPHPTPDWVPYLYHVLNMDKVHLLRTKRMDRYCSGAVLYPLYYWLVWCLQKPRRWLARCWSGRVGEGSCILSYWDTLSPYHNSSPLVSSQPYSMQRGELCCVVGESAREVWNYLLESLGVSHASFMNPPMKFCWSSCVKRQFPNKGFA